MDDFKEENTVLIENQGRGWEGTGGGEGRGGGELTVSDTEMT